MENIAAETNTIEGQFSVLLELQGLDLQVHDWQTQLHEKKRVVEQNALKVKRLQEQLSSLKKAGDAKLKSRSALEMDAKTRQEAVKRYNGQLLELKSNEAYSAMLSEIKKAQEDIAGLEDKILALMEAEESDKKKQAEESQAIAKEIKAAEAETAVFSSQAKELEDKVAQIQAKRETLVASLWKELSEIYVRLVKAMKGSPVAQILDGNCAGCRMKIPPHQINEIRKAKAVHYCQHCGRILIYPK